MEGTVNSWNWSGKDGVLYIMQKIISPRLSVGYMCSGDALGTNSQCTYPIKSIKGEEIADQSFDVKTRVLLNDGSLVAFSKGFVTQSEVDDAQSDSSGDSNKTGSGCVRHIYGGCKRQQNTKYDRKRCIFLRIVCKRFGSSIRGSAR